MVRASINIDLDTLADDIDAQTHVIHSDALPPITYGKVLPRFLDLLDRHGITATFFVIGRDIDGHRALLGDIAAAGHELANHTMTHDKQLVHRSPADIAREIHECGRRLEAIAGRPVRGFRAPGYTVSTAVIDALRDAGYTYDTSLNGSLVYSALKHAFRGLRLKDKQYVSCQPVGDLFGPRNPYPVSRDRLASRDDAERFLEIPVSVIPYVHYPFVTSVLLQFGLAPTLWSLDRLIAARRFVNCGVHINEFTDAADVAGISHGFYYTRQLMRIDLRERMRYFDGLLAAIRERCEIVLLRDVTA